MTVGQFRRFADETGYKTEAERDGTGGWGYNPTTAKCEGRDVKYNWRNPGFPQTDDHPVLNVTWNDAVAFCRWLSHKEKEDYRLPTEAEWEYAARAGTTTRYCNGDDPDALARRWATSRTRPAGPPSRTSRNSTFRRAAIRGSPCRWAGFRANRFGLCDVHGNVWEWCSDWYGEDYYAHSPVDDPKGPATGDRRVRRGGGWNSFPLWARAAMRNWNTARSRCINLGFRVARGTPAGEAQTEVGAAVELPPHRGEVAIVFAGDVMLDGGPGHAIVHGTDPFAEFAPILRGADVAVCNLECVLAPGGQQVLKAYTFRGPPQAVPLLARYFTAVGVANNHTGDFGPDAFGRQLTLLSEAGLECFGGGRNRAEARQPLILERNGLRIALLGYCGFPPRSFAAGEEHAGHGLDERERDARGHGRRPRQASCRRGDPLPPLGPGEIAPAGRLAAGVGPSADRRRRVGRHRRPSPRHADHRDLPRPADRLQPGQFRLRLLPRRSGRLDRLARAAFGQAQRRDRPGEVRLRDRQGGHPAPDCGDARIRLPRRRRP